MRPRTIEVDAGVLEAGAVRDVYVRPHPSTYFRPEKLTVEALDYEGPPPELVLAEVVIGQHSQMAVAPFGGIVFQGSFMNDRKLDVVQPEADFKLTIFSRARVRVRLRVVVSGMEMDA